MDCTETGFTPIFTYTPRNDDLKDAAIENVKVEIKLGATDDAACNKERDDLVKGTEASINEFGVRIPFLHVINNLFLISHREFGLGLLVSLGSNHQIKNYMNVRFRYLFFSF